MSESAAEPTDGVSILMRETFSQVMVQGMLSGLQMLVTGCRFLKIKSMLAAAWCLATLANCVTALSGWPAIPICDINWDATRARRRWRVMYGIPALFLKGMYGQGSPVNLQRRYRAE